MEYQRLLPNSAAQQPAEAPIARNLITGSAPIAQAGITLFALITWYAILSTPLILPSLHPLLNTLAAATLVNAILILQPTHTHPQKINGTHIHALFNAATIFAFSAGVAIIVFNKYLHASPHFTSWHGVFGITTFGLLMLQTVVGFAQFYYPAFFGGENQAKKMYKYHRVVGYVVVALVLLTATMGTQADWFYGKVPSLLVWLVLDIAVVVGLLPRIRTSKMKIF